MTAYRQIVSMLKQAGIIETDSLTKNQLNSFISLLVEYRSKEEIENCPMLNADQSNSTGQ